MEVSSKVAGQAALARTIFQGRDLMNLETGVANSCYHITMTVTPANLTRGTSAWVLYYS